MSAKITSREGSLKGKDLSFHQEITIGRDPKNKIFLNKEEISKTHTRFFYDETKKCYFIEDLQSRNGTSLDDTPIHSKERLGHLHVITLAGKYDFIFQDLSLCALRNPQQHKEATHAPPLSATVIADKPLVLPLGLGNKKEEKETPVPPVGETIIADKGFVLPQELSKKEGEKPTPAPPPSRTVIADKAFVLPAGLGDKKEEEPSPASPVGGTVIADKAFVLPAGLGEEEEKGMRPELSESGGLTKVGPEPGPTQKNLTQEIQTNFLDEEKTQVIVPRKPRYFLEVSQEEGSQCFPLIEGENVIGRKSICDLVIHSNQVSRRHAVLTLENGRFFIRDEQSKNKTFLEGKTLQKTVEIQINTKIRFGKIEAKLILEEEK